MKLCVSRRFLLLLFGTSHQQPLPPGWPQKSDRDTNTGTECVRPDVRHMHSIRAFASKENEKQCERECVDTDTTRIARLGRGEGEYGGAKNERTSSPAEATKAQMLTSHVATVLRSQQRDRPACLSLYMLAHNSANVRMCWFWCAMWPPQHHCSHRASCAPSRALNNIVSD